MARFHESEYRLQSELTPDKRARSCRLPFRRTCHGGIRSTSSPPRRADKGAEGGLGGAVPSTTPRAHHGRRRRLPPYVDLWGVEPQSEKESRRLPSFTRIVCIGYRQPCGSRLEGHLALRHPVVSPARRVRGVCMSRVLTPRRILEISLRRDGLRRPLGRGRRRRVALREGLAVVVGFFERLALSDRLERRSPAGNHVCLLRRNRGAGPVSRNLGMNQRIATVNENKYQQKQNSASQNCSRSTPNLDTAAAELRAGSQGHTVPTAFVMVT